VHPRRSRTGTGDFDSASTRGPGRSSRAGCGGREGTGRPARTGLRRDWTARRLDSAETGRRGDWTARKGGGGADGEGDGALEVAGGSGQRMDGCRAKAGTVIWSRGSGADPGRCSFESDSRSSGRSAPRLPGGVHHGSTAGVQGRPLGRGCRGSLAAAPRRSAPQCLAMTAAVPSCWC